MNPRALDRGCEKSAPAQARSDVSIEGAVGDVEGGRVREGGIRRHRGQSCSSESIVASKIAAGDIKVGGIRGDGPSCS
jgi:hypothetical protein